MTIVLEMAEVAPSSPEIVWDLITDWEHQGDWMLEASNFKVLSAQREGVGVEAEATVRIGGISTRDRVRVSAWEVDRHLGIDHRGWVSGRGDIHLTRIGPERTHVFWREQLHPPLGVLGTIGLLLLRPLMRRIFERDLRVLASLARARSIGARGGN